MREFFAAASARFGALPVALVCWVVLASVVSFCLFGWDKHLARIGAWRIRERTLFLSAIAGGSPGALLGMGVFHHKTLHNSFRFGIPAILLVQLAAAVWFFAR